MLLDLLSLEYSNVQPSTVIALGGAADGDADRRKLEQKIKYLKTRKRLREKQKIRLLELESQLSIRKIIEQYKTPEIPKEPLLKQSQSQLFSEFLSPKPVILDFANTKIINYDIMDEDDEIEEWLLLGD